MLQLPTSSSQVTSGSTSTPNSSISNMACLPEDQDSNSKRSPQETPSPPPAPNPPMTTTTTAIYARVNPNLKRDKTNNNNFSSTFAPIHSTTDQKLGKVFFVVAVPRSYKLSFHKRISKTLGKQVNLWPFHTWAIDCCLFFNGLWTQGKKSLSQRMGHKI